MVEGRREEEIGEGWRRERRREGRRMFLLLNFLFFVGLFESFSGGSKISRANSLSSRNKKVYFQYKAGETR